MLVQFIELLHSLSCLLLSSP
jgi:pyridoxal phosphate enzyme (YggS family)